LTGEHVEGGARATERLSGQDAAFLAIERGDRPMHIGAIAVFDAEPLRGPRGELDLEAIRRALAERLGEIPRCRQTLRWIPLAGGPVWVDAPDARPEDHVHTLTLSADAGEPELLQAAASVLARPLGRSRPPWAVWVIGGLDGGRRFAVVFKVHHCMADGLAALILLDRVLSPEARAPLAPESAEPGVRAGLRQRLAALAPLPGLMANLLLDPAARRAALVRLRALVACIRIALRPTSATRLTGPATDSRTPAVPWTLSTVTLDRAQVRSVRRALGGTQHDLVLAVAAAALRSFLQRRGEAGPSLALRALCPASVRTRAERDRLGNRLSALPIDLPVGPLAAVERLERVKATTRRAKRERLVWGVELLPRISDWTGAWLLRLGMTLAGRLRAFNLVITSLPGPRTPRHLLGARMLSLRAFAPVFPGQRLSIAVVSYGDRVCWGLNGAWPDAGDGEALAEEIECAFRELCDAASHPAEGAPKEPAPSESRAVERSSAYTPK
jgi:WS/DGAT/MGAT family acyltransferase